MTGPMPTIKDNLGRILRHYGLESHVALTRYEEDRAWGWAGGRLFDLIVAQGWDPDIGAVAQGLHGSKVAFREPRGVRPALQVCFHPYKDAYYVELDFDYASPSGGFTSFWVHTWEVLHNWWTGAKTNQAKVAKLLDKRGIAR